MANKKAFTTLDETLRVLKQKAEKKPISIKTMVEVLSGKGRPLTLIFLSLPFCQPLQIPGLSTPFGILIALIGLRMSFGKNLWLPKFVLKKKISASKIQKFSHISLKILSKIKRFIHPRLHWVCHHPAMTISNGIAIFFLGIFFALPLPIPLTNIAAAWAIFLIALGILEDDGILVLIGYAAAIVILGFFISLWFGVHYFTFNFFES